MPGVQYILDVIDNATAPFERMLGNIDRTSNAFDTLGRKADNKFSKVGKSAAGAGSEISTAFEDAAENATESIDKIDERIEEVAERAIDNFEDIAKGADKNLKKVERQSGPLSKRISDFFKKTADNIRQGFERAVSGALSSLDRLKSSLRGIRDRFININIRDRVTVVVQKIKNVISGIKNRIVSLNARDRITNVANRVRTGISGIRDRIVMVAASDRVTGVLSRIRSGIASVRDRVVNITGNNRVAAIASRIRTGLAGIKDKLVNINARDRVAAAVRSAKSKLASIKDKVVNITARMSGGGGGFGSGIMGQVLMGAGIMAGTAGAVSGIGSTFTSGMNAGKNQKQFEVLAGKEAGGQLYGDITKFAQDSIFGNELYKNATTMKAFGIETEKVMPNLRMLGDISMGDKDKLGSLTLAYSQIQSAGRLMGQDLLQLINAGFNPLQIISQKTGKSMATLKDEMEDGKISAKMVEDAFKSATSEGGMFYKMTEQIAETPFGKMEALRGQIDGVKMSIGVGLMPILSSFVEKVAKLVKALEPLGKWLQEHPKFINFLTTALGFAAIGLAGLKIVMLTMTAATWAFNAALWSNPVTWVVVGIIALAAAIAYAITYVEGWGTSWEALMEYMDYSWQEFKQSFHTTWLQVEDLFLSGLEKLTTAWLQFKSLWDEDGANAELRKIASGQQARMDEIAKSQNLEADFAKRANEAIGKFDLHVKKEEPKKESGVNSVAKELQKAKMVAAAAKGEEGGKGVAKAGKGKAAAVNGGGRPSTINITIHKLQDNLIIHAGGTREGGKQAGTDVTNELIMALESVNDKGGFYE